MWKTSFINTYDAGVIFHNCVKFILFELQKSTFNVRMLCCISTLIIPLILVTGCKKPVTYRHEADDVAYEIIKKNQLDALGRTEEFSIERPSDILRRRLLEGQDLALSGAASLGSDKLDAIQHWPDEDYLTGQVRDPNAMATITQPIKLTLLDALKIGARNSFDYQSSKENVFRAALDLDLEINEFRSIFAGQADTLVSTSDTGGDRITGTEQNRSAGVSKKLKNGAKLTSSLSVDMVNLLTLGGASSLGLMADATVSIPLMRGSGKHIVAEPLTQAQREVIYAIYDFERFKRTFAVEIARSYLGVLSQLDQVKNAKENHRSLNLSVLRSKSLAREGRLPEFQVDQAVQNKLRARSRWVSASESYKSRLDTFKNLLGLPTDAKIELDRTDMEKLVDAHRNLIATSLPPEDNQAPKDLAEMHSDLIPSNPQGAGPLELDETVAIKLALENRLDLRTSLGVVYDAQRKVVTAADKLGAELTLFGSADLGSGRSIGSARSDDARLRPNEGAYQAVLTMDLPLERTAERNLYRASLINLESAIRSLQLLEDNVKLAIRNRLRDLSESRENLKIQAQSVTLADKRVQSINLLLELGRAAIRDLLEAEEALLQAKNDLTSAAINYRVAELELQRDLGLLQVNHQGLWNEYTPE